MPCSLLLPQLPGKAGRTHPSGAAKDEGGYRCEKLIGSFHGGRGSMGEPGKFSDPRISYQGRSPVETTCYHYSIIADVVCRGYLGESPRCHSDTPIGEFYHHCHNRSSRLPDARFQRLPGFLWPWGPVTLARGPELLSRSPWVQGRLMDREKIVAGSSKRKHKNYISLIYSIPLYPRSLRFLIYNYVDCVCFFSLNLPDLTTVSVATTDSVVSKLSIPT